jgi:hypothetical protein
LKKVELKTYIINLRRIPMMAKSPFNQETYELQLAEILLEALLKQDAIEIHTYRAVKRKLIEMEDLYNEYCPTITNTNTI